MINVLIAEKNQFKLNKTQCCIILVKTRKSIFFFNTQGNAEYLHNKHTKVKTYEIQTVMYGTTHPYVGVKHHTVRKTLG